MWRTLLNLKAMKYTPLLGTTQLDTWLVNIYYLWEPPPPTTTNNAPARASKYCSATLLMYSIWRRRRGAQWPTINANYKQPKSALVRDCVYVRTRCSGLEHECWAQTDSCDPILMWGIFAPRHQHVCQLCPKCIWLRGRVCGETRQPRSHIPTILFRARIKLQSISSLSMCMCVCVKWF